MVQASVCSSVKWTYVSCLLASVILETPSPPYTEKAAEQTGGFGD